MNFNTAESVVVRAVKHYVRSGNVDAEHAKEALRYLSRVAETTVDVMFHYKQVLADAEEVIDDLSRSRHRNQIHS